MLILKLHLDEVDIDTELAANMVAAQFPRWAASRAEPVFPAGTDNVMFRFGSDLVARLPRTPAAARQLEKEIVWQDRLEPFLPVSIPVVVEVGMPAGGYPFPWTVARWLPGRNPVPGNAPPGTGVALAHVVKALHGIVPPDPTPELTSYRGAHPNTRDLETRTTIARSAEHFDTRLLNQAWSRALQAPRPEGSPTLIHTDLHPGNLLVHRGRLSGVIDWSGIAVGDPAVDLIVAWNLLDDAGRLAFRRDLAADSGTWDRGRAWALSIGLVAFAYYKDSDPLLAAISKYQIEQVLAELT